MNNALKFIFIGFCYIILCSNLGQCTPTEPPTEPQAEPDDFTESFDVSVPIDLDYVTFEFPIITDINGPFTVEIIEEPKFGDLDMINELEFLYTAFTYSTYDSFSFKIETSSKESEVYYCNVFRD